MHPTYIVLILVLILIIGGQSIRFASKLPTQFLVDAIGNNKTGSTSNRDFTIGHCHLFIDTTTREHTITLKRDEIDQIVFSSINQILIDYYPKNASLLFSSISNNRILNSTEIVTKDCYANKTIIKRNTKEKYGSGSSASIVITLNSSSFIDYHYQGLLDYPLRLSLRFRTLGRISNGVLLSLTHRNSSDLMTPFIIIEHSNGKIEITILQIDERKVLSTVTTVQCGKNINNDNWHWLQFEIDQNGIFTVVVDDDSRTSQIPSYVVSQWYINALLVGDTGRFSSDIFQPFIGYMSDLIFNDEYLFHSLTKRKGPIPSTFEYDSRHITVGYRIAFFNLVTIDTQQSYIAFSERENQNKNHGKLDIYFLFRSYVSDGIILYRYAQGLQEYFAIGLRAGILTLFIDFGFGKRQIVSDQSKKLADGKWHEVRVSRLGTDKIELIVDNRVNRTILSTNGIRNAVSLQPVLYVGGIPNSNNINLTDSGLNAHGFQGCLSSFIVDGRLLDYQRALVLNGQVKMNVCSADSSMNDKQDLNKLCYDFTCVNSGVCSASDNDGPKCDCIETGYTGERCDKLPKGFYFGKHHSTGLVEYQMAQTRQTEHDVISFGLQTLSTSTQIFRLESDSNSHSLEYEIVRGRSYISLNLGEKQPDVYSVVVDLADGMYHAVKIVRRLALLELYIDGNQMKLEGGNKYAQPSERQTFLAQRRLRIGSFKSVSPWNGIIAGFSFNRQWIFETFPNTLSRSGDVEEVYPDEYTGLFNLIETSHIATAIISPTTTVALPVVDETSEMSTLNWSISTTDSPRVDNIVYPDRVTAMNVIPKLPRQVSFDWLYKRLTHFGIRGLLIGSIISISLLLLLLFLIIYMHCKTRKSKSQLAYSSYNQSNGNKTYSQIQRSTLSPANGHHSKKFVPRVLRYLHTNPSKSSSFRLKSNHSISRLNSGDSYHLISSIQENHKENKKSSYQNADCILNEHCFIHSTISQPTSSSIYHQVNRLILSGSEPPLPNHVSTLRSIKRDLESTSAQTYSAVYSCDLAENLDMDQELLPQIKRRSILKTNPSVLDRNQLFCLYMKNLVDCYALQPNHSHQTMLLATADENRIQLSHVRSGILHSQLPLSSVGACHKILFSYNGQFLIGLFYEVTSNVNPYAVKIWSTDDYSIRANLHPIKCSIAVISQHSSILYMAGKQKYGRGISLGLLDIDSCSLARELKSDPDTTIGDEIKRIILTRDEAYALVACTEYTSTFTCFVVFKLEAAVTDDENDPASSIIGSMNNCTMILTKFNCDPNFTFSMVDSNNNGDQYMLTILRTNEIIIWQLIDGEILFTYDANYLLPDHNPQSIIDCQMNDNRLLILAQQGSIFIWDVPLPIGQFSLIADIADPLIHSISWLDHEHFLSIDDDGHRIRTWNIPRKEVVNESLSLQSSIQSLYVHATYDHRKEYFLAGTSMNERSLVMFEYAPSNAEQIDLSHNIILC